MKPPLTQVEVVIEVPRGSFLKRGSGGRLDFLSPLPCPYNYGSVPAFRGGEGDALDAVVLGPRMARGRRLTVPVRGCVGFTDNGIEDDKLICGRRPVDPRLRGRILAFFHRYAGCKRLLNALRGRFGATACLGWRDPRPVIERARARAEEHAAAQGRRPPAG